MRAAIFVIPAQAGNQFFAILVSRLRGNDGGGSESYFERMP